MICSLIYSSGAAAPSVWVFFYVGQTGTQAQCLAADDL